MTIASLLSDDRTLRDVDRGIVSALPGVGPRRPYDRWAVAAFYDGVVATRAYNRVIWGTTPDAYIDFERRAIISRDDGVMLDAACGSLAFTANLFAGHRAREVVLLDYSLGMLRRARRRIEQICGSVPSHLTLLHADIHDLPFRDGVFSTVSFPAALHEFRDPVEPLTRLRRVLASDGAFFVTSLVAAPGRRLANRYLQEIHRGGLIAAPRTAGDLASRFAANDALPRLACETRGSMAFFTNAARASGDPA